jgi:hypothetical protein
VEEIEVNLRYVFLRLIRHFMPEVLARLLLKRRWVIQPGLESSDPETAASRYVQAFTEKGMSIPGKRVLVFGYGGRFAIGVELLKRGALHVVLSDHFISLDNERNLGLLPKYTHYLGMENGTIRPRPEFMTLLHGDIRKAEIQAQVSAVDCVLSNSVYEHLDDVDGITRALTALTRPNGLHLHYVDLRDHYFKYPFEMLAYPSRIWNSFLNPTSNLNRFRLGDYRNIFTKYFKRVDISVLERLENEFQAIRPRIRPEFLSGDPGVDSVTLILIFAELPRE